MKRIKYAVAVIAVALGLVGCGEAKKEIVAEKKVTAAVPGQAVIASDSPQLAQIRTESVELAMVPVGNVSAPGKVEANANRLSHVVLPVPGRVTTVLAKIGDFVRQGQPLMTIESPDAEAAVANFQQAQAGVTQAKSAMAKAQMDMDRQKDLFEHGAVPQKEVFNTQAVMVQAQAARCQSLKESVGRNTK